MSRFVKLALIPLLMGVVVFADIHAPVSFALHLFILFPVSLLALYLMGLSFVKAAREAWDGLPERSQVALAFALPLSFFALLTVLPFSDAAGLGPLHESILYLDLPRMLMASVVGFGLWAFRVISA